jgi:hypothetical protein
MTDYPMKMMAAKLLDGCAFGTFLAGKCVTQNPGVKKESCKSIAPVFIESGDFPGVKDLPRSNIQHPPPP